jgi:hypothetical protein
VVHTGVWWGNPREKEDMENTGIDGKTILSESRMGALAGLIWLRIGTRCGQL